MFDKLNRTSAGPTSPLSAILPHPSMAKWPILRQLTGFQVVFDSFKGPQVLVTALQKAAVVVEVAVAVEGRAARPVAAVEADEVAAAGSTD
jgi:hypothetical protein